MAKLSKHTEWLSLVEISGPFLAVSVLDKVFPQGLEAIYPDSKKRIRNAYEEWCDALNDEDPAMKENKSFFSSFPWANALTFFQGLIFFFLLKKSI